MVTTRDLDKVDRARVALQVNPPCCDELCRHHESCQRRRFIGTAALSCQLCLPIVYKYAVIKHGTGLHPTIALLKSSSLTTVVQQEIERAILVGEFGPERS